MPRVKDESLLCRRRGVLMHVSSLPSNYGIGSFGKEAYRFIDLLAEAGADIWAFLPLGPAGYGNSPYQCFSAFALNPYFLDLETLVSRGLLSRRECKCVDWGEDPSVCDFGALYRERLPLLLTAYARALQKRGFDKSLEAFAESHPYIKEYALFMAIKDMQGGAPWYEWPEELKRRDPKAIEGLKTELAHEYRFCLFIQKELFAQWNKLRNYAAEKGVALMGDMPIYCAYDSADCWAHPNEFLLDKDLKPEAVAGVPPDYFCELGQRWGNPLYNWKAMKKNGYNWWLDRIKAAAGLYDILRIDHFRGFEAYYSIPADAPTAQTGEWKKAGGFGLFKKVKELGLGCEIVAEDLGFITPNVKRLLTETGFAGMQVLEFAFGPGRGNPHINKMWDGDPAHLKNKACYTSTHDNAALADWWQGIDRTERLKAMRYAGLTLRRDKSLIENIVGGDCAGCPEEEAAECGSRMLLDEIRARLAAHCLTSAALRCDARYVLIPLQDILCLGKEARMNTPGTEEGNWCWRATGPQIKEAGSRLKELLAEINIDHANNQI